MTLIHGRDYTKFMNEPVKALQSYALVEHTYRNTEDSLKGYKGKRPTYIIDGVRVTKDQFDTVKLKALMFGNLSCFQTKVINLGDDSTKVIQYVTATY